jgi:hypothetical protein
MEDLFFYIRENLEAAYDPHAVSDLSFLHGYINRELENVRGKASPRGGGQRLLSSTDRG